jgi:hypothetical protein
MGRVRYTIFCIAQITRSGISDIRSADLSCGPLIRWAHLACLSTHRAYLAVMHGPRHLKLLFYTARTSTLLSFSGHKELCFLYSFTGQICHSLSFHPSDQVD